MSSLFPGSEKFPRLVYELKTLQHQQDHPGGLEPLLIELTTICNQASMNDAYADQVTSYAKIACDFETKNIELKGQLSAIRHQFNMLEKKYNSKVQTKLEESLAVNELKSQVNELAQLNCNQRIEINKLEDGFVNKNNHIHLLSTSNQSFVAEGQTLILEISTTRAANIAYADENQKLHDDINNKQEVIDRYKYQEKRLREKIKDIEKDFTDATLKLNQALKQRDANIKGIESILNEEIEKNKSLSEQIVDLKKALEDRHGKNFADSVTGQIKNNIWQNPHVNYNSVAGLDVVVNGVSNTHQKNIISGLQTRNDNQYKLINSLMKENTELKQILSAAPNPIKTSTTPGAGADRYAERKTFEALSKAVNEPYKELDEKELIKLYENEIENLRGLIKFKNKQINSLENKLTAAKQPCNIEADWRELMIIDLQKQLKHKESYASDTEKYAADLQKQLTDTKDIVLKCSNGNITLACMYDLLRKNFKLIV